MNSEYILSKECIFFNPKDNKCHFVGFCEKLTRECPGVERWFGKQGEPISSIRPFYTWNCNKCGSKGKTGSQDFVCCEGSTYLEKHD